MLQVFKNYSLPIAITVGIIFNRWLSQAAFIMPYMIFAMLLFTFSRVNLETVKFNVLHMWLMVIQLLGSLVIYGAVSLFDPVMAQGLLICVLAPTAVSASVIVGMLGGNVPFLIGYVLISSVGISVGAPLIFSFIGNNRELPFLDSALGIAAEVMPMLILPLVCSLLIKWLLPVVNRWMVKYDRITFYLWAVSLTVVTGRTVYSLVIQDSHDYLREFALCGLTLVLCCAQFIVGRRLGRRYVDAVAGGQGLGQKNTVLAIWLSHIYLHPVAAIAPSSYILWQNLINSYQLWRSRRRSQQRLK